MVSDDSGSDRPSGRRRCDEDGRREARPRSRERNTGADDDRGKARAERRDRSVDRRHRRRSRSPLEGTNRRTRSRSGDRNSRRHRRMNGDGGERSSRQDRDREAVESDDGGDRDRDRDRRRTDYRRRRDGSEDGGRTWRRGGDRDRESNRDDDRSRRERKRRRSPDGSDRDSLAEQPSSASGRKRRDSRDGRRRNRGDDLAEMRRPREAADQSSSNSRKHRPDSPVRKAGPLPSQADSFALVEAGGDPDGAAPDKPKEKPNYGNSGVLAAASNTVVGARAADGGGPITLRYHEPPEARKPPARDDWRLFIFKGADLVDTVPLGTRSCWLVGREPAVVDLLAEHPSVSKQHAVLQFRYVEKRDEFGDRRGKVKPYLLDLESANGTELNGDRVPESRFLELRDKDVVKFGSSTREYVVMLAPRE